MFTESDQAIAPGARVGPYRVLHRLAVGGMAELFLAHAVGPAGVERLVVLKQILPGLAEDAEFVEMFLNEARLASVLSHPNIVQILDVGSAAGAYFLVMEYVHGRNVSGILREGSRRGEIPLACAVGIVDAVAAACHYAHNCTDPRGQALSIIHRDVTPSNVLVSSEGAVKLTDFGIAKAVAQSPRTRASAMKGKIGYMAPEQARSQHVDARTDVFALGVLLYELTTRTRCFAGDSDYVTLNRIVEGEYRPPSEVIASYPAQLERIVRTALQPNPDDRYASAAAMQSALAAFCDAQGLRPSVDVLARYVAELTGFPPYPTLETATLVAPHTTAAVDETPIDRPESQAARTGWPSWAIAASALGGAGIAVAALSLIVPDGSPPTDASSEIGARETPSEPGPTQSDPAPVRAASEVSAEAEPAPPDAGPPAVPTPTDSVATDPVPAPRTKTKPKTKTKKRPSRTKKKRSARGKGKPSLWP